MSSQQLKEVFEINEDLFETYCSSIYATTKQKKAQPQPWQQFILDMANNNLSRKMLIEEVIPSSFYQTFDEKSECLDHVNRLIDWEKHAQKAIDIWQQNVKLQRNELQDLRLFWKLQQTMDQVIFDFCEKNKRQNDYLYQKSRFYIFSRDYTKNKRATNTLKQSFRRSNFVWAFIHIYLNWFLTSKQENDNKKELILFVRQIEEKIKNDNSNDKDLKIFLGMPLEDINIDQVLRDYYLFELRQAKNSQVKQKQLIAPAANIDNSQT